MLSVLALTLVATRLNVFDQCLLAMGRIRLLTALNVVRLIALFVLIPLGHAVAGVPGAVVAVVASALFNGGCLLVVQHRFGLLDVRRELLALPLFGVGLAIGWLAAAIYQRLI